MRSALFIFLLTSCFTPIFAQIPNIGDNSQFSCVEFEYEGDCYGDIYSVKKDTFLSLGDAQTIVEKKIKRLRNRKRNACRNGSRNCSRLKKKFRNFKKSRTGLVECWEYQNLDCSGNNPTTTPDVSFACTVATNPSSTPATSSLTTNKFYSRIANGIACRSANNSPVLAFIDDGFTACTATLIRPNVAITAAHCLDVSGFFCGNLAMRTEGGQFVYAKNCYQHPNWTGGTTNDVALIVLKNNVTGVTPVEIHTAKDIKVGDFVVLAGYGSSEDNIDELKATLNYVSKVTTTRVSTFYEFGQENIGTTCVGDSGSPLLIYRSGKWKTIGTLSGGGPTDCLTSTEDATTDTSNWANLTDPSNVAFINGILGG